MKAKVEFIKMQGAGNDFVVLPDLADRGISDQVGLPWNLIAQRLLDRHYGVGADQLMVIQRSKRAEYSALIFNCDGSAARMCGNGVRCVARYLKDRGLTRAQSVVIEVAGELLRCHVPERGAGSIAVELPAPTFAPEQLGIKSTQPLINQEVLASGRNFHISAVGISGSPHCVTVVQDLDSLELERFGPALERLEIWGDRANVEFVMILSPERVKVRVWERGSGITLACGSGACAVVAALAREGRLARRVEVQMPGGVLEVEWRSDDTLLLSGPAEQSFSGEIDPEYLKRRI